MKDYECNPFRSIAQSKDIIAANARVMAQKELEERELYAKLESVRRDKAKAEKRMNDEIDRIAGVQR